MERGSPGPVRRYFGGPADGAVCPGHSLYGIHSEGGVYRWDPARATYAWRQHVPPFPPMEFPPPSPDTPWDDDGESWKRGKAA